MKHLTLKNSMILLALVIGLCLLITSQYYSKRSNLSTDNNNTGNITNENNSKVNENVNSTISIVNSTMNSNELTHADDKASTMSYFYFKESQGVLDNPFIGFVPIADATEIQQPFKLVYAGTSWKELEPEKGYYAFKRFEEKYKFDFWRNNDVKVIIRIYMDYPTDYVHKDIPDWLYYESIKKGWEYSIGSDKGYCPDYSDEVILQNHKRLLMALGERYDNDPVIAFVEIGSLGHWGEWHNSILEGEGEYFPKTDVTDKYVQDYLNAFKNKKLLMRRPFQIALDNGLGLFNDSFGDTRQTEDYFLSWIENGYEDHNADQQNPGMPNFWISGPSGGEFANSPGSMYLTNAAIKKTLSMLQKSHTSWLGPSAPIYEKVSPEIQGNLDSIKKIMGYRFYLESSGFRDSISPGGLFEGELTVINRGIAPFYYMWPIVLYLEDMNGNIAAHFEVDADIRRILPGKNTLLFKCNLPEDLPAGKYKVKLAVLDPDTNKPSIQFANEESDQHGRYLAGNLVVIEP